MSNGIAICNFTECEHSQDCKRYIEKGMKLQEYNFKAICFKDNGYEQLMKNDVEIKVVPPVKEDIKKETDTSK